MPRENILKSNYVADENESIGEAMQKITDNQRGAVAVADVRGLFRGVVSDGDIRRGMLAGATQMTPVGKIANMNAKTVRRGEEKRVEAIFTSRPEINMIPVVDKRNILVDVIVRNPGERKIV